MYFFPSKYLSKFTKDHSFFLCFKTRIKLKRPLVRKRKHYDNVTYANVVNFTSCLDPLLKTLDFNSSKYITSRRSSAYQPPSVSERQAFVIYKLKHTKNILLIHLMCSWLVLQVDKSKAWLWPIFALVYNLCALVYNHFHSECTGSNRVCRATLEDGRW